MKGWELSLWTLHLHHKNDLLIRKLNSDVFVFKHQIIQK